MLEAKILSVHLNNYLLAASLPPLQYLQAIATAPVSVSKSDPATDRSHKLVKIELNDIVYLIYKSLGNQSGSWMKVDTDTETFQKWYVMMAAVSFANNLRWLKHYRE